MTIFRRRRRNSQDQTPILEASASPSAYFLADFDKENVVNDHSSSEGTASTSNNSYSISNSNSNSHDNGSGQDNIHSRDWSEEPAALSEYSLKMDDNDESSVRLSVHCNGVDPDGLNVQVHNGVLHVDAQERSDNISSQEDQERIDETSSQGQLSTQHKRRQSFQLDEQSLDIENLTARLEDGMLNITVPKKQDHQCTRLERLPIFTQSPPKLNNRDEDFRIIIDLPGVRREDIYVCYANGKFRVSASRTFGSNRSFKRTLPVDTQKYDPDRLKTYLHKGQLTVVVPPKQKQVTRTIDIGED